MQGGKKNLREKNRGFWTIYIRDDTVMITLDLVLAGLLTLCILVSTYWGVLNYRRFRANRKTAEELDRVMTEALALVKNNQTLHDSLKKGTVPTAPAMTIEDLYAGEHGDGEGIMDLESPAMLSTILTVIIHKYGTAKLSLNDFRRLPEDEYVSVYVDSKSRKIVLSMDHDLAEKNPIDMINFTNSDDSTFH
tara:strand:- start:521 stop:1096 length:576 start_codon:yes stop_codon:yes gene_type:complete